MPAAVEGEDLRVVLPGHRSLVSEAPPTIISFVCQSSKLLFYRPPSDNCCSRSIGLLPLTTAQPYSSASHSDIDRDVVSIALSYFDRYLSCHQSLDETLFQLVAMTSLYLSVKMHSTKKISIASMVR